MAKITQKETKKEVKTAVETPKKEQSKTAETKTAETKAAETKTAETKATETTEPAGKGGGVPAVRKSAALAEPEKKKLPAQAKKKTTAVTVKKDLKKPLAKTKAEGKEEKAATRGKAAGKEKTVVLPENYFEIDGMQIREEDIRTRIEEAYKDAGHRIGNMKKLQVYYNFAERRAYYVINGKAEGLFIEF